jgi:hypothetical protein
MAEGLYTTDQVASSKLYTEFMQSIELTAPRRELFRDLFCNRTEKTTVRVTQSALRFVKGGFDESEPPRDRTAYREISLPTPRKFELAAGFTKEAWERGLDSSEVRTLNQDALAADERLIQELVLSAMLTDGGFWDANMTLAPPAFQSNSFTTSHDHYLAANATGEPTLAHVAAAKHHLVEHGYGGFIGFWPSSMAELVEGKAEWETTANYVSTPVIARLQEQGIMPGETFVAAGVPFVINDWLPEHYFMVLATNVRPCHWRDVEGPGKDLITYSVDDFTKTIDEYRRYGSVKVTSRGAGVVYYLNSGTYSSPTFTYSSYS